MRRLHICEEAGTDWDKMVFACEYAQLPAPRMTTYANDTKVTLYSQTKFADIPLSDRIFACYLHDYIQFMQGEQMSNASLRKRFWAQKFQCRQCFQADKRRH
jgi:ATP-dependent DNA helicase RecG